MTQAPTSDPVEEYRAALDHYRECYRVLTERGRMLDSITPDMTPAERTRILKACRDEVAPPGARAAHMEAARRLKRAFDAVMEFQRAANGKGAEAMEEAANNLTGASP